MEGELAASRTTGQSHDYNDSPKLYKLIVTNCQSIKSKKDSFINLLSIHNPDFFIGTESWLTNNIRNNEIFPPGYTIYRRDRSNGDGGVFIGCRSTFTCICIDIETTSEIVSCKVDLAEGSLLIIAAYQPPNNNLSSAEYLSSAIESLILYDHNSAVWVAGDLNFPNVDWKTWTVNNNNYPPCCV